MSTNQPGKPRVKFIDEAGDDSTEAHGRKFPSDDEGTEGHAAKLKPSDDEGTEGHAAKGHP